MCGATHKQFAIFFVYVAAILLNMFSVIEVNFYLQVILMLGLGKAGALFPDVDHVWKNVKEKTAVNWLVNKFIHITGGTHRSRHTHSWDLCLMSFAGLLYLTNVLHGKGYINELDCSIAFLILCGFYSGWISHLFSDMLSSAGVYVTFLSGKKVKFVPKELFGFKFSTGGAWENFCFKVIRVINLISGIFVIVYPFLVVSEYRELLLSLLRGMKI